MLLLPVAEDEENRFYSLYAIDGLFERLANLGFNNIGICAGIFCLNVDGWRIDCRVQSRTPKKLKPTAPNSTITRLITIEATGRWKENSDKVMKRFSASRQES